MVGWSRTMQVTPSRPTQHTHPCTRKHTQSARSDLGAWPMCTMSKEVFRAYQSSMNTNREGNLRGERVKLMFPLMRTKGLCFLNSGGHSLRDRTEGETRYSACNFSVHTLTDRQSLPNREMGILNTSPKVCFTVLKWKCSRSLIMKSLFLYCICLSKLMKPIMRGCYLVEYTWCDHTGCYRLMNTCEFTHTVPQLRSESYHIHWLSKTDLSKYLVSFMVVL